MCSECIYVNNHPEGVSHGLTHNTDYGMTLLIQNDRIASTSGTKTNIKSIWRNYMFCLKNIYLHMHHMIYM